MSTQRWRHASDFLVRGDYNSDSGCEGARTTHFTRTACKERQEMCVLPDKGIAYFKVSRLRLRARDLAVRRHGH